MAALQLSQPTKSPAVTPNQAGEANALEKQRLLEEEPFRRLKFARDSGFQSELRRRVDEYFRTSGRRQRDCPQMYLKTAVISACFVTSYILLVFVAETWWQAVPLAIALGLSMAAIGFNIQHDAGHKAYSNHPWINRLMALSLDLIGGSSYIWHRTHNILHHTYVNVTGYDLDIDLGFLARMTPYQKRLPIHRFQHWYMWPLFSFAAIRWQLVDDFRHFLAGRFGPSRLTRPRGWDLVVFLGGKLIFFSLAFGVPLLWHRWWVVLLFYGVVSCVLGLVLGVVFQLAHCVEEAAFAMPPRENGRIEESWAAHQVRSTVDFAPKSRAMACCLGGLNFQIEHHLFPHICHVNYPAMSPLVEQTCKDFGLKYCVHQTFRSGVASHYRWLRRMGRAEGT